MKTYFRLATLALFITFSFLSCQPAETDLDTTTAETQPVEADSVQKRAAPDFFIIPPEMVKSRVWLCDNEVADIFHVKNDCPLFMDCKATKRNVSLPRAIEEYGRYNCTTCSKELDHIFDEDMIRGNY